MVIGHGIDLVEVNEVERDIFIEGWLERIFHSSEIESIPAEPRRNAFVAGRIAAKEAILKALGCGFGNGVAFTDIRIQRNDGQCPSVVLKGGAAKVAEELGITLWSLSISHTASMATASAIAE